MNSFAFHNPTKLISGRGQLQQLPAEAQKLGSKVLLVYGGGSIKKNGVYDSVVKQLNEAGCKIFELSGVEPNPRLTTVHRGADICRAEKVDWVLAVGGGSVIDCAKGIAAAAKYDGDFWDIVTRKVVPQAALPLGLVLTLAATGSEMNSGSVITNWETHEKYGWGHPLVYPRFAITDPDHTRSVPLDQTIYGIVDIMSHIIETYFHPDANSEVQTSLCEGLLRAVIVTAPKLVKDLDSFEHRQTMMHAGTMALNGVLGMGVRGDWATHNLEHAVSAVYDIPHGGGLAILFPNWMKHTLEVDVARYKRFAVNVFGIDAAGRDDRTVALEGIAALREFWTSIGAPSRLADYKIDDSEIGSMADKAMVKGEFGNFKKLNREDCVEIYKMSL